MYGIMFPRDYSSTIIELVGPVFECMSHDFDDAYTSWLFAKRREALGDKLYSDPRLVMFSETDMTSWTELQMFYKKSGVQ